MPTPTGSKRASNRWSVTGRSPVSGTSHFIGPRHIRPFVNFRASVSPAKGRRLWGNSGVDNEETPFSRSPGFARFRRLPDGPVDDHPRGKAGHQNLSFLRPRSVANTVRQGRNRPENLSLLFV